MAKRRNRKNGPEKSSDEAPSVGHNSAAHTELTEDQRIALTFVHKRAYEAALAVKKKADAELKNVCKLAKAELGADAVDTIKDMIALETEEGEKRHKAEIERRLRAAKWMGLSFGAQGGLFDVADMTPAVEKAYANGKRDGLAGNPQNNPHDPSVPQHGEYLRGWHDGQSVLAQGFRKPTPIEEVAQGAAVEFDDLPERVH